MSAHANDKQIGGDHYARGGRVQHWDFTVLNGLGYLEGCATKYVSRWQNKGGVQDLQKSLHYIEKLMELHATGRLPVPTVAAPLVIQVEDFARANGLGAPEEAVCQLLTGWRGPADLQDAWEIVDGMIKDA